MTNERAHKSQHRSSSTHCAALFAHTCQAHYQAHAVTSCTPESSRASIEGLEAI